MPICPDCRRAPVDYDEAPCPNCGWEGRRAQGVPELLSHSDRNEGLARSYRELYNQIAADDLAESIQLPARLTREAQQLLGDAGPVAGLDVCEVGVGQGTFLRMVRDAGARSVTGVDLAAAYLEALDAGDPGVRLVVANAENLPFRSEFDLVVASDVLEHVLNAADFLGSCVDAVRPGGRLVIKVPYRENLTQYRTHEEGCPYPMVHLRTFDRALLRQALQDAGLRVESLSYGGFYVGRLRPALRRFRPVYVWLSALLRRAFGAGGEGLVRINPRLGRLLMRPVTVTAVTRRP